MGKYKFDQSDFDDETALYIDKYFKKVIINAKKQYLSRLAKDTKVFLNSIEELKINSCENCHIDDIVYEEFEIDNAKVRIYNEDIANALERMNYRQRYVIIKNYFFDSTIEEIARELKVSTRMVDKYKKKAMDILREEYEINEGATGT